jgi:hypothetical protein
MAGLFIRVLDEHGVIFLLTPTGLLMEAHGASRGYRGKAQEKPRRGRKKRRLFRPYGACLADDRVPTAYAVG